MSPLAVVQIGVVGVMVTTIVIGVVVWCMRLAEQADPTWCAVDWDQFHAEVARHFPGGAK